MSLPTSGGGWMVALVGKARAVLVSCRAIGMPREVATVLLSLGANGSHHSMGFKPGRGAMLMVLAFILLVAWLLGVVGTYTIGAFVHVLLVMALVLFLVGIISGRRTVV